MLQLLLLHSALLLLLLVFCSKHHDDRNQIHNPEPREKEGGLKKGENKRLEASVKEEEQTGQKKKAVDEIKGAGPDEKVNQRKEEEKMINDIKEEENTRIPDPDYTKLAFDGMTEAEIKADDEAYAHFCAMERAAVLRHSVETQRKREYKQKREKEGIIEEESTQFSYYDDDYKHQENKSEAKKSKKNESKKNE